MIGRFLSIIAFLALLTLHLAGCGTHATPRPMPSIPTTHPAVGVTYRFELTTLCFPYTVIDADPWRISPPERVLAMYRDTISAQVTGRIRLLNQDQALFWRDPEWRFQLRRVSWEELEEECPPTY